MNKFLLFTLLFSFFFMGVFSQSDSKIRNLQNKEVSFKKDVTCEWDIIHKTQTKQPILPENRESKGWEVIENQDFESSFPSGLWSRGTGTGYADATWDDWYCWYNSSDESAGCADYGGDGISCGENYPNDMHSWMIYGPFDLSASSISDADFSFYFNLTCYNDDYLFVGASINGSNLYGTSYTGTYTNELVDFDLTNVYQLGNLLGEPEVWIGFIFHSGSSTNMENGAQVDDITIWKNDDGGGGNDPYETNNSFAEATSMPLDFSINDAYINPSGDEDYFTVPIGGVGTYTIDLTSLPDDYDLYFYDPNQSLLASSTAGGTTNEQIVFTDFQMSGYYYIKVKGYGGAYHASDSYHLQTNWTESGSDDFFVENASISPSSVPPGGNFTASCEQHYAGNSTTTLYPKLGYYLSTNNSYGSSDIKLGEDESSLSSTDPSDPESESLTIPAGTSPGQYYILFFADYDNFYPESNENNNVAAVSITIDDPVEPDIELDPTTMTFTENSKNGVTPYKSSEFEIGLKKRRFVPDPNKINEINLGIEINENNHILIQFFELPSKEELKLWNIISIQYIPNKTIMAKVPDNFDWRAIPTIRWVGLLKPSDKLSHSVEELFEQPYGSAEQTFIVEAVSDVKGNDLEQLIIECGGSLKTHPDLPDNIRLVTGSEDVFISLSQNSYITWINVASVQLLNGSHVCYCPGGSTIYGIVPNYVTNGPGWDGPGLGSASLKYYFENGTPDISGDLEQTEIINSMNEWSNYVQVSWTETTQANQNQSVDFEFATGNHGDNSPFDGPGGVLAHCFYPAPDPNPETIAGDCHFDEDENWNIGSNYDMFSVSLHELGHGLGLNHSADPNAVMYAYYQMASNLHDDDIAGIQSLYAAANNDQLTISNVGDGTLTINSITDNKDWLSTSGYSTSFNINPGNSQTVQVSVDWALVGNSTVTGIITITSNDPDEPSVTVQITAIPAELPDFFVENASISPTSVPPGGSFTASCEQHYSGNSTTTLYPKLGYYLSTNNSYGSSDISLGDDESSLSVSDPYDPESETLTIPTETSPGQYYILFFADYDNTYPESNEGNNTAAVPITVLPQSDPVISGTITESNGTSVSGVTVTFSNGGGSTTTAANGTYSKTMTYGWSGTATPSKSGGWTFSPTSRSYSNVTSNQTSQHYTATGPPPVISGTITQSNSTPVSGVTVTFSNGGGSTTTAANGTYSKTMTYGWSGTATPSKSGGWTFSPTSRSYSNVTSNQTSQNYTATGTLPVISGTITQSNSTPVSGVTVIFSNGGGSTTTSASGAYSKTVPYGWSGTATPTKTGWTFSPTSRNYSNVTGNQGPHNYTGSQNTPVISGTITDSNGTPIPGVAVLGTITASNGTYSATVSYGWSGQAIPNKAGWTFSPPSRSYSNVTSNQTGQNYTGEPQQSDYVIMEIPDDIMGSPGDTDVHAPIHMDNQTSYNGPVASMQLVISYDASIGIHLQNTSYELTGRTTGFSVSMTVNENGANSEVTVLLFNTSGGTIAAGTGSILDLLFDVDANATTGATSNLCFTECLISDQNANPIPVYFSDCGVFEIPACEPCDINCDGQINIFDLQHVINCIIGSSQSYCDRADVNNDGQVNIFDLQMVINCIIGNDSGQFDPGNRGTNTLTLPTLTNIVPGSTGNFGLNLANQDIVSSGQIEFTYNSTVGFDVTGVTATSRLTNYSPPVFSINTTNPAAVKVTVLFFSMSGGTIASGNGDILTYQYTTTSGAAGSTNLTFNQTLLSDPNANALTVNSNDGSVTFGDDPPCDPGWDFVVTPLPHYITIPLSANPMLFDDPIEPGDFIGVFYHDENNDLACGGYAEWTGTENIVLIAFGDDNTTQEKDGFASGETLSWKIYDCSGFAEYNAFATYDPAMPNSDGTFVPYGLSKLLNLESNVCQELNITSGWSGVSLFVEPDDPAVANIFQAMLNDVVIMSNLGSVYWPDNGINTIGDWDNTSSYAIKLQNSNNIELCGIPVNPSTLTLDPGWHYMPNLSSCNVNVQNLFSSVVNDIIIVQEIAGTGVYWPEMSVNTLGELVPGKGYTIKVENEVTIDFPSCSKSSLVSYHNNEIETPWNKISATPNSHQIAITGYADLLQNSKVGVFDQYGVCYGYSHSNIITVFADDLTTSKKDGFIENEPFEFRLYNLISDEEYSLDVEFDQSMPNADLVFNNHGLSAISELKVASTGISEMGENMNIQIVPNPAKEEFVLILNSEFVESGQLTIYKLDGQVVGVEQINAQQTKVNISHLSNGVYILQIEINGKLFTKRLVKN